MSVKNICLIIAIFNFTISNAQHFVGFTGGYSVGKFANFSKEQGYNANYHFKSGIAFSSFYETKMDSGCNIRIELQYKWQHADMEIEYNAGRSSFSHNSDYSFHLLSLNPICLFRLVEKKKFKLDFLFGLNFAYNINTTAKGNGGGYHLETQIDTNGNSIPTFTIRHWEKNEHNSKDLSKFNFGVDIGVEFIIPINNKMDFLFQNRYHAFLTSIIAEKKIRYTSLFTGYLNIGFRYNFYQGKQKQ